MSQAASEKFCQSCGMPLAKDPTGSGGVALKSEPNYIAYCSYCVKDGDFLYTGDDVKEFQHYVVKNMVENGWIKPLAWLMTRQIPRLKRWRKS